MHPVIVFDLFGVDFAVKSYILFALFGAFVGMAFALPLLKRGGLRRWQVFVLLPVLAVAFLVGARLFNVLVNPAAYKSAAEVFQLRFAGFSLYGGLGLSLSALLALSVLFGFDKWKAEDALVLPASLAFCLARVGCFLNGCCGGKATDSALGVVLAQSKGEAEIINNLLKIIQIAPQRVWPTQLFEMGLALAGLAIVIPLVRRLKLAAGSAALLYAVWFTAARWAVLPFRSLPYGATVTEVFYPALYGSVILVCAWLFYRRNRKDTVGPSASRPHGLVFISLFPAGEKAMDEVTVAQGELGKSVRGAADGSIGVAKARKKWFWRVRGSRPCRSVPAEPSAAVLSPKNIRSPANKSQGPNARKAKKNSG